MENLDTSASLLIRHAERLEIPSREVDHLSKITPEGRKSAELLGNTIGQKLKGVTSSSVPRCLDTSEAIINGSGVVGMPIEVNWRLGNPGVWVIDGESAWSEFIKYGLEEVIRKQVNGEKLNGFRELNHGVQLLLDCIFNHKTSRNGVNVLVSHDAIIAPLVGYLLGKSLPRIILPGFLEGVLLQQDSDGVRFFWNGRWKTFTKS